MPVLLWIRRTTRKLVGDPILSLVAILALALGTGLTATTFSIVYGGILRGLPFERPDQILHVEEAIPVRNIESTEVPLDDFRDWQSSQTSFSALAGYYQGTVNITGEDGRPERYSGAFTTPELFAVARVQPILGRVFTPDETGPASPPVIILGYGVWRDRFGSDSAVLGAQVRANGELFTVIGVMPEGYLFPQNEQVWLPLRDDPAAAPRRQGRSLEVVGRLRDDRSMDQAMTEFTTIARRLEAAWPEANAGVIPIMKPFTEEYVGPEVIAMLWTMLGAVVGVLLIACANVANLLLARTAARGREVAIRTALGASRFRVVIGLLGESLALAAAGGVLGFGLAHIGVGWFNRMLAQGDTPPFWIDVRVDPVVVVFMAGIIILAAVASGLVPALQASGVDVNAILKDESRGTSGFRMGRFSRGLVVFEVAMSCALLVAAGLMVKSVVQLRDVPFGFETEGIVTSRVGLFEGDYPDTASRQRFFDESLRRMAAVPGVQDVAYTSALPATYSGRWDFALDGESYPDDRSYPAAARAVVSPGFFRTFGVGVVRGRLLDERDLAGAVPVAVVNESFVARHLAGREPLGARIRLGTSRSTELWREVVGVVPDLHMMGVQNEEPDGFYLPLAQSDARFLSLVVRGAGTPGSLVASIRETYLTVDPNLPIYNVRTMPEVIALDSWFYSTFGTLFIVFGAVGLFMAALGLYGVMAFGVHQRHQEIGVRMALGAQSRDVVRLILGQGLRQLALGMVIGLVLSALLAKSLTVVLFGVEPGDPLVYAIIVVAITATGFLASFLPSRRAVRIDPLTAMRSN